MLKNKKSKTKNKRHILIRLRRTKILNIFKFLVCVFYILFFIFDFIFFNLRRSCEKIGAIGGFRVFRKF